MFLRHWLETLVSSHLKPRSHRRIIAQQRLRGVDRRSQTLEDRTLLASVAINNQDLHIDEFGGPTADNLTLVIDTTFVPGTPHLRISDPDNFVAPGPGTFSDGNDVLVALSSFSGSILIDTGELDDRVTLDYSGGDFDRFTQYDGGVEFSPIGDQLTLTGGSFTSSTHDFGDATSGSLALTGGFLPQTISYSGTEGIHNQLQTDTHEFLLPEVNNPGVFLVDGGASNLTLAGGQLTDTTFAEPMTGLTIRGRAGTDDAMTVSGISLSSDLTIDLQTGDDSISFATTASSLSGATTLKTSTLAVNAGLSGTGSLQIVPNDPTSSIGIGESATGTLNLDAAELANLANGFSSILIGDATAGTGAVEITSATFADSVSLVGGSIALGEILTSDSDVAVTLTARTGSITTAAGTNAGNVTSSGQTVTLNGVIAPGGSPGQLVVTGNLVLDSGDTVEIELEGDDPGTGYDQIVVAGDVTLNNAQLDTTRLAAYTPSYLKTFTIIDNQGVNPVTGTFLNLNDGDQLVLDDYIYQIDYDGGDGNDVVLTHLSDPNPNLDGTANDDTFDVYRDGTELVVELNSVEIFRQLASITDSLSLNGLDGNDTFDLDYSSGSLGLPISVDGNGHLTDPINVTDYSITAGGTTLTSSRPDGDVLNILGAASFGGQTYTINGTSVSRTNWGGSVSFDGLERLVVNTSTLSGNTIEIDNLAAGLAATVNAGDRVDYIDVTTTAANSVLTVNAGGGDDVIDVATTDDTSLVFLSGESGSDTITVVDTGSGAANGLQISGGSEIDIIQVQNFAGSPLLIEGDTGDDQITLLAAAMDATPELRGGDGNDVFKVTSDTASIDVQGNGELSTMTSHSISARVTTATRDPLIGDTLHILDTDETASSFYTITGSQVQRTGGGILSYTGIESLNLETSSTAMSEVNVTAAVDAGFFSLTTGSNADSITISDSGAGSVTQVNSRGSADTIHVVNTGDDSLLFIDGGAAQDMITISDTGSGASSGVQILGSGGGDTINIESLNAAALRVEGGDGDDQISLGTLSISSDTELFGGNGNDTFNLEQAASPVDIHGGANLTQMTSATVAARGQNASLDWTLGDRLNIDDSTTTTEETFTLTSTAINRSGWDAITFDTLEQFHLDTSDTATTNVAVTSITAGLSTWINTGSESDDIDISTTAENAIFTVNAGGGNDTIDVVTTADTSLVFLNGEAGEDAVTVLDTGTGSSNGLQILGGDDADQLTVQNFDGFTLHVDGDGGDDTLEITATAAGSHTEFLGGTGDDIFNVGLVSGSLTISGEDHETTATNYDIVATGGTASLSMTDGDLLNILDAGHASMSTYTLTPTTVTRSGAGTIDYNTIERLELQTSGTESSDIDISNTAASVVTTIVAGAAADTIDVTTTGADSVLVVLAGADADTLQVHSTHSSSLTWLHGEDGDDAITVVDSGAGATSGLQISGGADNDEIEVQNFAGLPLLISGDGGNDQISLLAAAVDSAPDFLGGDGNDIFNVTSDTASIRIRGNGQLSTTDSFSITARSATATLTPEVGDTLNILDGDASAATTYTVAGSTVVRDSGGTISFDTVETMTLQTSGTAAGIVDVTAAVDVGVFTITTGTAADQIDIAATADGSVVIVNAGDEDDTINVTTSGTSSLLFLNGGAGLDAITVLDTGADANSGVHISGGVDVDTIDVQNLDALTLLIQGDAGDDTITLGTLSLGTNPELHGGEGDDTFNINEAPVSIDIDGGTHSSATTDYSITVRSQTASLTLSDGDRLNIIESTTSTEETYTLDGETFTRTGWGTIAFTSLERLFVETGATTAADVDLTLVPTSLAVTVTTGSAEDDIDVTALAMNTALTINSGGGTNTIDVADTAANSMVFLNGGAAADQITVQDTGAGMMTGLSINGDAGNDIIRIDNFDGHALFVSGGNDHDSITVSQTAAGSHTELNGNDGDDTFTLASILGALNVDGGSNGTATTSHQISARDTMLQFDQIDGDQLTVLDATSTDEATYTLGSTTLTRDSWGSITYNQTEQLRLETSQTKSSTININSLSASSTATVIAGNEADIINVVDMGLASVLTIDAGMGNDQFNVTTTADASLLYLNGEEGEDTIDVTGTGSGNQNGLQISGGTDTDTITVQQFDGHVLNVAGDAGADVITLTASAATSHPELSGGDGDDTFNITSSTTSIDIAGGSHTAATTPFQVSARGTTIVRNQTIGDVVNILDSATAGADYALSGGTVVRTGGGTIATSGIEGLHLTTSFTDASSVELTSALSALTFSLTTGTDSDDIDIATTAADSVVTVNSGEGADMIDVVTTGTDALLFLNGQAGADLIQVTGTGSGLSSGLQIQGGSEGDTLAVQHLSARVLHLNGDGGNDAISLLGTATDTNPELDGGDGDDVFTLMAPTVDISLHGGNNSMLADNYMISARGVDAALNLPSGDRLSILDSGSTTAETYTLTASTFTRTDWGTLTYDTLEQIQLEASATAASDIDIQSTAASTAVEVTTGSAADDIDVQTTGEGSVFTINSAEAGNSIDITTTGANSLTFLNSAAGEDQISIAGTGSGVSSGLQIDSGPDADTVNVTTLDALVFDLSTGSGLDSITFLETSAGTNTEISGGADNDTVRLSRIFGDVDVAGDTNGIATTSASITARGSMATVSTTVGDQLLILDAASVSESTYDLSSTTTTRTGWGMIAFQTFEQLAVETSSTTASTINVASLSNGTATEITAGGAADVIDITTTGDDSVLTVNAGGGADEFLLTTSGSNALLFLNGEAGSDQFEVLNTGAGVNSGLSISGGDDADTVLVQNIVALVLAIHGNAGDDELTLNAAAAGTNPEIWGDAGDDTVDLFAPSVAIDLHGGSQTTATGDSLNVSGGSYTNVVQTFLNTTDGQISYDGAVVTYDGIEPISDRVSVQNRTFWFNRPAESISLSDDADVADGESLLDSTPGNAVTFSNPTASLTVNTTTGSGADTVIVSGLDSTFAADVSILGDNIAGQKDSVSFTTNILSTGGGNLTVETGGTITIEAGIATLGGDVTLHSESQISSTSAGSITTTAGVAGEASGAVDIFADGTILLSGAIHTTGAGTASDGGHIFIRNVGPGATGGEIAANDITADAGAGGIAGRVSLRNFASGSPLTLNGLISTSAGGVVRLLSEGAIVDGSGDTATDIIAGAISAQARTTVGASSFLDLATPVGDAATIVAASTGNGVINLRHADNMTVGAIGTADSVPALTGIRSYFSNPAAFTIAAAGELRIDDAVEHDYGGAILLSGDTIVVGAGVTTPGSGSISVDAVTSATIASSGSLSTVHGALTISGNAAGTATGESTGVLIDGGAVSSINGAITISGTGGDSGSSHGLVVQNGASLESISLAAITLTGIGNAAGSGILFDNSSLVGLVDSIALQAAQGVSFTNGANITLRLASTRSTTEFDPMLVSGTLSLTGSTLTLDDTQFTPTGESSHLLFDNDGTDAILGNFTGLPEGTPVTVGGEEFTITYVGGDGNDIVLLPVPDVPPVPESTSSIIGYNNGNWWVSTAGSDGEYTTSHWARWPTTDLLQVLYGDFNGDGLEDIAGWLPNGDWRVGLAQPDKSFTYELWTTWRTDDVKEVHVGDFDNDGRDDLVGLFKSTGSDQGNWWVGRSTGSSFVSAGRWATLSDYFAIETVLVGNFDGVDGADLAILTPTGDWRLALSTNDRFISTKWATWDLSSGADEFMVGDFDGNGMADVIGLLGSGDFRDWTVGLSTGTAFVTENWGQWKFSTGLQATVVGDFDGDLKTDIAALMGSGVWWTGLAEANRFRAVSAGRWSFAPIAGSVLVGDTNGDGLADILGRASTGYWWSAESNGSTLDNRSVARWSSTVDWKYENAAPRAYAPTPPPAPLVASDEALPLSSLKRWTKNTDSPLPDVQPAGSTPPAMELTPREFTAEDEQFFSGELFALLDHA
ncbi:FG-GAP repeat domain-containing protein [Rubinisphaera margarita]|uniref:FG-GAP repeat domain-containing protein n=1 Tax=Rubinisphaera margarita TaxID=2909586 RepID=UPI001EE83702|nr:VCBS repeat-containing protein [Rubinisphaera margarita]MCG6154600.1 VCBS repeat-containing protein [Rubinisphaera margarita]